MKKRIFSGIQPTNVIHIGNYFGAIAQWLEMQNNYDCIFSIVDLHAITVPQKPDDLKENTYKLAAIYLACGIDPKKVRIFVQSQISEHCELAWILNTITYMGELERMTQYKEKIRNPKSEIPVLPAGRRNLNRVGLFDYPVLMAADILLYDTDLVPVGEDQVQHVELTRDLAKRFNHKFGETFKVPNLKLQSVGARVMGLDDPAKKMSKSAESVYNYIAITDEPDLIRKKIAKAQTDSGREVRFDEKKAGLYNLLAIYKLFSSESESAIEKKFAGRGYGDFKKALAELICEKLNPIQMAYKKLTADKNYLDQILTGGANSVRPLAHRKLKEVKQKIGLI